MIVVNLLQSYAFFMKYTKKYKKIINICIYQKKAVPLHQLNLMTYTIRIIPLCKHSEWHASVALFHPLPLYLTLYTLHQPHSLQKMTRKTHFFASKLAYTNKKQ